MAHTLGAACRIDGSACSSVPGGRRITGLKLFGITFSADSAFTAAITASSPALDTLAVTGSALIVTRLPPAPAAEILLNTDRSRVFSPAFPFLSFIIIYRYLFTVPSERARFFRQDMAASSGAIIASTRIAAITQAAILFALLFLKFIIPSRFLLS